MERRKMASKKRYFLAFIIGTIVFLLVLGISYSLALFQYTKTSDTQGEIAYSFFEEKVANTFFGDDICESENFEEVSVELGEQGRILEDLENKFGKNNEQVLERKKFYSVLLLEHLDYTKRYNEDCVPKKNTILFFYSNQGPTNVIESSDKAGRVLGEVVNNDENVLIYSFDSNLNSSIIERLKDTYNVTKVPEIIINEDEKIYWPFSVKEIENFLI